MHMCITCIGFCVVGLSSMQAAMFTYNEIYQVGVYKHGYMCSLLTFYMCTACTLYVR